MRVNKFPGQEEKLSALMKTAQEGDQFAYQSLLEECAVLIREFAMRRLSKSDSAEDVVQETLMSIANRPNFGCITTKTVAKAILCSLPLKENWHAQDRPAWLNELWRIC
jgi:hypothetical protein